jgi:hypothetical protein
VQGLAECARRARRRVCAAALVGAGALLLVSTIAAGASLPDGRRYELVSPVVKNAGDVMPDSGRTRAAVDGAAVNFASLTGFADVRGTGVATEYVSVRDGALGTNGWSTHAITPPQQPLPFVAVLNGVDPTYMGEFSDDLSRGVFRAWSPLTSDPNVQDVVNLYVRNDLRVSGPGSYELVTPCPGCGTPLSTSDAFNQPWFAGASSDFGHIGDFGHIVFESKLALTADATAEVPNLYEWDHGTLRLAGILPDSACAAPPCPAPASQAGQGAASPRYTPHVISADGSRIIFTDPSAGTDGTDGVLYLRTDHATTVAITASERTGSAGEVATATYWDASTDGTKIFFTTGAALTDDAPPTGDRKVYRYDVTPDAQGHHLTFVSADHEPADDAIASDDVTGVIGSSADGDTVYFADLGGQLAAGASTDLIPGIDAKLFRWHDGTIQYVGSVPSEDIDTPSSTIWNLRSSEARVSPDGQHLLFSATSGAGLTGYDHGSCPGNGTGDGGCHELYVFSAGSTPPLQCASCNPSGAPGTADAHDVARAGTGASATASHLNHPLSDDGRRVFFTTAEALVPEDQNGKSDAYEYDTETGTVHLLSSGNDASDSYFMDASSDGTDAFFVTRQQLVGWDTDSNYDLYDARVSGGFPEPVVSPICTGEECRAPVSPVPGLTTPGTLTAVHSNGPRPTVTHKHKAKRCRRGYARRRVHGKVRCVRVKHRHRRTHHRRNG